LKDFTHRWVDFDGVLADLIFRRFSKEKITETIYWGGELDPVPTEEVAFIDICPPGVVPNPEKKILVFDHHPHGQHPWKPESKEPWQKLHTATSKVIEFLSLNLEDPKIAELVRWAYRADFQSGGDPMNIANIVKEMHLLYSDEEVRQWVSAIVDAHFQTQEVDLQKGVEFFKFELEKFLSENLNLSARAVLQRWLERADKAIEDKMNIVHQTAVNFTVFDSEKTKTWLNKVFKGVEEDQRLFREAAKDFEKAEKFLVGRWVIVIATTTNPRFNRYCRSFEAKKQMPRPLGDKEDPIVVQFWPENKGFQIFTNSSGYKLFDIAGSLRTEILRARKQKIPPDWQMLKAEGTLPNTEPLYYQKGDYEVLMWGSLTAPRMRQMDISSDIVKRIVSIAIDQNYWPKECQKTKECLKYKCEFYPWYLWRCYKKRQQNRKPSILNA
jgi:hypothetical protein